MPVEISRATSEEQPVVANLLELYAHDFSEFHHLDLGPDGRFGYRHLATYWSAPDRHPFLVKVDGRLAGFVLVKRSSEVSARHAPWDIAELFVVRAYRRQGVGTHVAHAIWRLFPGQWEVRVMQANRAAFSFWDSAIGSFLGKRIGSACIEKDDACWYVFAFQTDAR